MNDKEMLDAIKIECKETLTLINEYREVEKIRFDKNMEQLQNISKIQYTNPTKTSQQNVNKSQFQIICDKLDDLIRTNDILLIQYQKIQKLFEKKMNESIDKSIDKSTPTPEKSGEP